MTPTEAEVMTRARQLFEEETGRIWDSKPTGATASASPDAEEATRYIERAKRELAEIEEEGHS